MYESQGPDASSVMANHALVQDVESLKRELSGVLLRLDMMSGALADLNRRVDEEPEIPGGWDGPEQADTGWVRSFDLVLSGLNATIKTGTIRLHAVGNYAVAADTLTLSASTEWIYAQLTRASGVTALGNSATEPVSDATYLRIPLYLLTKSGSNYSVTRDCRYDVQIDFPIMP